MRALYYNCSTGISGYMNVSAMLDLGMPLDYLLAELDKLGLGGYSLDVSKESINGVVGTQVRLFLEENADDSEEAIDDSSQVVPEKKNSLERRKESPEFQQSLEQKKRRLFNFQDRYYQRRHYSAMRKHVVRSMAKNPMRHSPRHKNLNSSRLSFGELRELLENSAISENAKVIAVNILKKIAEAESVFSSKAVEEIVSDELSGIGSIVGIVASAIALDYFKVGKVYSSRVELGGGLIQGNKGALPVPRPLTSFLTKALPTSLNGFDFECTTTMGAGIIAGTVDFFDKNISGKVLAVGYGIRNIDSHKPANILNVSLLEIDDTPSSAFAKEDVVELSANIEDIAPEQVLALTKDFLAMGALDIWQQEISTSGTSSFRLTMLCRLGDEDRLVKEFLKKATLSGVTRELKSRYIQA